MEAIKNEYTMKQAAKMLGVHRDTIMYWEENKLIPMARRDPRNNYRKYYVEEIIEIAKVRGIGVVDTEVIEREKADRRKQRQMQL